MTILSASKNGQFITDFDQVSHYLDEPREGVYEALQTYHGQPFRLDEHLARLERSAQQRAFELPYPISTIRTWCLQVIADAGEARQFVVIVVSAAEVVILAQGWSVDPQRYQNGFKVMTVQAVRPTPDAKSLAARVISSQSYSQAKAKGYDEVILVNKEGFCTEGAYSNLFWVKKGKVFTTTTEALPGITQEAILEAAGNDYPIQTARLKKDELFSKDELILSSSRIEIAPVTEVDGQAIGEGKPGPITQTLMQRFHALTEQECSASTDR